jgi:transcriptional regulator with XRE-family HTH domain
MGYSARRQLYSAQFGRFSVSEAQEKRSLSLLGQAIREIREQRSLSAIELASAAQIKEQQINEVEEGRLDPDFELLLKLSQSMGLRPSAFILRAEELASHGDAHA